MKLSQITRSVSATAVLLTCVAASAAITDGLVGYWSFDETNGTVLHDATTNANHGTLRNGPVWTAGLIGGALNFSGASQWVYVPNYPKASNTLTVSAWVWADTRPTWASIAKNWPAGGGQFHLGLDNVSGLLSTYVMEQNRTQIGPAIDTAPFPLGSWQHVATVYDGSRLRVYRNGAEVGSIAYDGTILNPPPASFLSIAAKAYTSTTADSFWDGKIDDLGLWNRALGPAEIAAIYGAGLDGRSLTNADIPAGANGTLVINEFMASNKGFLHDEDGDTSDWIELYNGGVAPVNLDGWFLTDKASDLTQWRFPATNLPSHAFLVVFASGKNRAVAGAELHTSFQLKASGDYLALVDPYTNVVFAYAPAYPPQVANVSYGLAALPPPLFLISTGSVARAFVPSNDVPGLSWIFPSFDDSTWLAGGNGVGYENAPADPLAYTNMIQTDVGALMFNRNPSVYARFPLVVSNPADFASWRLQIQYADGFVLWLNGVEVLRRNAPDLLAWNSSATAPRLRSDAVAPEEYNLAEFQQYLVPGTNLLAIQGLNASATNSSMVLLPQILAQPLTNVAGAARYFTLPTPGGPNVGGVALLGPIITELAHTPAVPLDGEDLLVTARVDPAFGPITNVTLHYRVMFSNEVALPMWDDGAHGDGAAGDGLFGATIPASASRPGQMVRYYVSAADGLGRSSRWPLFLDPYGSAQYQGTVVQDLSLTNHLPVIHWFVASTSAADTATGTQCSLFYDGELYDNVFVRIRGCTARSWPKKSYKIEFNKDHHFRLNPDLPRVREFDLNTAYTDKAYVRAVLTYEHQRDAGMPSPENLLLRVQQNAQFFSVVTLVEQVDEDFLRRNGQNPGGALYKATCNLTFVKRTRLNEDTSDLQAFLAGLNQTGAALERFVFDNVDVPMQVNYMATVAITQNIDASDKNHYLYRDTEGTGEWRMLPWDLDLTFGPNALNTDVMVYNQCDTNAPACASHPFIGARPFLLSAGKYEKLLEGIVNTPRARQMLLRRIRTLTDSFLGAGYFERRIDQLVAALGPDVLLDHARWGGNSHFCCGVYTLQQATDRIKNEYLTPRLPFLRSMTIPGIGADMPASQPPFLPVQVCAVEFRPASGIQAQEYLCLTNPNPIALDLTGWRLRGDVQFDFKPATVIPANGLLYLSPDVTEFRARSTGPRGGQGLFVQGNYSGNLSARGGRLELVDNFGRSASTFVFSGAPSLAQQFLRITQLMYHPAPLPGNTNGPEQFEFIQLKNISTNQPLDLTGVRFVNGIAFDFTTSAVTNLAPGQTVLLVKNLAAFTARYGAGFNIAGQYAGSLNNGGERLRLVDAWGEEILDFTYDNNWRPITDGLGFVLVIADENAPWNTWGDPASWRPSSTLGGSPGTTDPGLSPPAPILVNEVLVLPTAPAQQAIELFNPNTNAVDVSGWFISNEFDIPDKFRVPYGTFIPAGGFAVFTEADFNPVPGLLPGFSFSPLGDGAWLFSADAAGNLTGYEHGFGFGAASPDVSFGRYLDSQGQEQFVAQVATTFGAANAGPRVGPVVISEIMYHPPDFGANDNQRDEFVELQNITATNVALFDAADPSKTWHLRGAVDFDFPTNIVLTAGARLLAVGFDPVADAASLAGFRAAYGLGADVPVLGPWSGKLNNASDTIKLNQPGAPLGATVPYILVEEVSYLDHAPWPGADGDGTSLQRVALEAFGNDPTNWAAALPTPGAAFAGGTAPRLLVQPATTNVVAYRSASLSVSAVGSAPLLYQWRHDGTNLPGATDATLLFTNVQPEHYGFYSVVVYNSAGSVSSTNALLNVLIPVRIVRQPQGLSALLGANATFTVAASGTGTLFYQWRKDGADVPGATNDTLTLTNLPLAASGAYSVLVTDDIGSVTSQPATLIVLGVPVFTQQPTPAYQEVLQGSTFTIAVAVVGTQPLSYKWRRNNVTLAGQTNALLRITNAASTSGGSYVVIITNLAGSATSASPAVVLYLADTDRDGLPDFWLQKYFGHTNALAADLSRPGDDADGDGMSNLAEYIAGTDPTNRLSCLRLDALAAPGLTTLTFQAVSNRAYGVQFTDLLGPAVWQSLADLPVQATNRTETLTDRPATNRFYRLRIPAPP